MSQTVEAPLRSETTQIEPSLFPPGYIHKMNTLATALAEAELRESEATKPLTPDARLARRLMRDVDTLFPSENVALLTWQTSYDQGERLRQEQAKLKQEAELFLTKKAEAYFAEPPEENKATITVTDKDGNKASHTIPFTHQELEVIRVARKQHNKLMKYSDGSQAKDTTGYQAYNRWFPPDGATGSTNGLTNRKEAILDLFRAARAAEWAIASGTTASQNGYAAPLRTIRSLPKHLQSFK